MTRKRAILFVCIGNTCRSPMAECIAKEISKDISVSSCGINTISNKINPKAVKVLNDKLKIDITDRKPININNLDMRKFDTIYSLDKEVSYYLNNLNTFSGNLIELVIDDPHGQDIAKYYETYNEIYLKLKNIAYEKGSL